MRATDCTAVESPEFLLAALEQAADAVLILDGDLRVSHCNAAAETIWGSPRAELLGRDATSLGLDDLQQPASEITVRRNDGSRVRAALSVSRVEVEGRSNYMVFARDITAEFKRRDRFALLTLVADATNRAVVVTDPELKIVYVNAAFAGLFGYSVDEVMGQHAERLLTGRCTDRKVLTRLRRQLSEGHDGDEEILLYDKNGDESWVSATIKAFRRDQGGIKYLFALLTDISETKRPNSPTFYHEIHICTPFYRTGL